MDRTESDQKDVPGELVPDGMGWGGVGWGGMGWGGVGWDGMPPGTYDSLRWIIRLDARSRTHMSEVTISIEPTYESGRCMMC